MAKFRVNQRVKKVRGSLIGTVGTVAGFSVTWPGFDVEIRMDNPLFDDLGRPYAAGSVLDCKSVEWEPLILGDQHLAADDEALLLDLSRFAELVMERVS